eukprot:jgi/Mesvir1/466/Mv11341-RA.1
MRVVPGLVCHDSSRVLETASKSMYTAYERTIYLLVRVTRDAFAAAIVYSPHFVPPSPQPARMEAVTSCSVTAWVAAPAAQVADLAAVNNASAAKAMCGFSSAFHGLSRLRFSASVILSRQAHRPAFKRSVAAAATAVDKVTLEACINTIRFLAIDAVERATNGYPGLPMGCAPMGYILFNEAMKFNPKNPAFFNRDRFVLSAGHGGLLQYALLHLTGFDSMTLEDLQRYRQWGSNTPAHPENVRTAGIEITTGPLGQGVGNAVGMALAEKHLAARFNKPGLEIVDHYTYCLLSDGCAMEGVSTEAASLAGHWGLGKLIALYDDNHVSIDGPTELSFTEDVAQRFAALGWHTLHVKDGNRDYGAIRQAIDEAKRVTDKPTLIQVTTTIGYGSPNKADSHVVHGAALGLEERAATRENLGWEHDAPFVVPPEVRKAMTEASIARGAAAEAEWATQWTAYTAKYPKEAAELESIMTGELPPAWEKSLPRYTPDAKAEGTRNMSQTCLNALGQVIPGFLGGSADLAPSCMTLMSMFGDFQRGAPAGRNLRFGAREHAMGAISNGIARHSPGLVPYCATYLVFTDYMRAAIRMAAMSQSRVIYIGTHDSVGMGEDGKTNQPSEHLASFRAMPNVFTMRPCDGNETAAMYEVAVASARTPSLLCLTRQKVANVPGSDASKAKRGAYVICDSQGTPDVIFLATGSEVESAVAAARALRAEGKKARVVSMPCWELFERQTAEYRELVLPSAVRARVVIEAASRFGWERYAGERAAYVTVDGWGASAAGARILEELGFGTDAIVAKAKSVMT